MQAINEMYRILSPLKLYRLNGESMVDKELAAYAAGFSLLEHALSDLWQEGFLSTATDWGISRWEELLGRSSAADSTEQRKAAITGRLTARRCTASGITAAFETAGLPVSVSDAPGSDTVSLSGDTSALAGLFLHIRQLAEQQIPPHLLIDYEALGAVSWNDFDGQDYTWLERDALDLTWNEFESGL